MEDGTRLLTEYLAAIAGKDLYAVDGYTRMQSLSDDLPTFFRTGRLA